MAGAGFTTGAGGVSVLTSAPLSLGAGEESLFRDDSVGKNIYYHRNSGPEQELRETELLCYITWGSTALGILLSLPLPHGSLFDKNLFSLLVDLVLPFLRLALVVVNFDGGDLEAAVILLLVLITQPFVVILEIGEEGNY